MGGWLRKEWYVEEGGERNDRGKGSGVWLVRFSYQRVVHYESEWFLWLFICLYLQGMHTVNTAAHHQPFTACCSSSLCRYQPNMVLVTYMVDHRLLWAHLNDLLDKQGCMWLQTFPHHYPAQLASLWCYSLYCQYHIFSIWWSTN